MSPDRRADVFIHSLERDNPAYLKDLEQCARRDGIPVIRRGMQSLLRVLLAMKSPGQILEVGTAAGFSALFMQEYAPEECHITTIEKYGKRIALARENFIKAGKQDRITLLEGDAAEIMKGLEGPFDMIFMDAAKGQYIRFLPDALRLLPAGGIMVSDNILREGDIMESRFAVARRNRTIHARMREYLYEISRNAGLETVILTLDDGVAVSVKR